MKQLSDICGLIRSKNAGPFVLTFDIMFNNEKNYQLAKKSRVITKEIISKIYSKKIEDITVVYHDQALAIKISFPRSKAQGGTDESDCYGGQQYLPIMGLKVG